MVLLTYSRRVTPLSSTTLIAQPNRVFVWNLLAAATLLYYLSLLSFQILVA